MDAITNKTLHISSTCYYIKAHKNGNIGDWHSDYLDTRKSVKTGIWMIKMYLYSYKMIYSFNCIASN